MNANGPFVIRRIVVAVILHGDVEQELGSTTAAFLEVLNKLTVVRLVGRVAASIIQINVEVFYALVCFEAKAVIYFHAVVSSTLIGMHGHGAVTAASKQRC